MTRSKPYFAVDHFSDRIPAWLEHVVPRLQNRPRTSWLEVGSFEGQSALWTLDNVLTGKDSKIVCVDIFDGSNPGIDRWGGGDHDYELTFDHNLSDRHNVQKIAGRGRDVLPRLKDAGMMFNGGYLDSDHSEEAVRAELRLMWDLMLPDAVVVVDDYDSPYDPGCKVAVDKFLSSPEHQSQLRVLYAKFQLIMLRVR